MKKSTILAYAFFYFPDFFVSAEFGFILLLFCVYIFCALEYKAKSNTDVILNSNSDYFFKHGSTNNPVWECFAKTKRIYNIFSFKIGKDTYKKEINIKNSVSVLKMLQNLIIYLHAGHLKMVDVHFLRGCGGSGKVCFLHTLENG